MRDRGPRPRKPDANLNLDRYEFAFETLALLKAKLPVPSVYDLGLGDGRMQRIESLGLRWKGFDQTAWSKAERWDLAEPCPIEEKAGAALLLDVIEHCPNPGLVLKNIASALLCGGRLVITTPNPRWSASRLHTLVYGWPSGFTALDLAQNHHVLPVWPHVLEKFLGDAGFVVDQYVTLDGVSGLFRHRLSVARVLIEKLDRSACGMSYAVVARKSPSMAA